jgi:hypothetical protein
MRIGVGLVAGECGRTIVSRMPEIDRRHSTAGAGGTRRCSPGYSEKSRGGESGKIAGLQSL